jgi:hypothetical protein
VTWPANAWRMICGGWDTSISPTTTQLNRNPAPEWGLFHERNTMTTKHPAKRPEADTASATAQQRRGQHQRPHLSAEGAPLPSQRQSECGRTCRASARHCLEAEAAMSRRPRHGSRTYTAPNPTSPKTPPDSLGNRASLEAKRPETKSKKKSGMAAGQRCHMAAGRS